MPTTFQQVKSIPKIDLHRHIEGSVSPKTLLSLYQKATNKPKSLNYFKNLLTLKSHTGSLDEFITKLATPHLKKYVQTPNDLCFVFQEALKDAATDNVTYLELRFCPSNFLKLDKSVETLLTKIHQSMESTSQQLGIKSGLIFCFKRDDDQSLNLRLAKIATKLHQQEAIIGTDLAGNEHLYPNHLFKNLARVIHQADIPFTVHAGEVTNPDSVKTAITLLGAKRIGHGTKAALDPKVMELLAAKNILLEVCPTSNLDTGAYNSYDQIPIETLMKSGVPLVICTDDPVTSDITLSSEITTLIDHSIITIKDYHQMLDSARSHTFA